MWSVMAQQKWKNKYVNLYVSWVGSKFMNDFDFSYKQKWKKKIYIKLYFLSGIKIYEWRHFRSYNVTLYWKQSVTSSQFFPLKSEVWWMPVSCRELKFLFRDLMCYSQNEETFLFFQDSCLSSEYLIDNSWKNRSHHDHVDGIGCQKYDSCGIGINVEVVFGLAPKSDSSHVCLSFVSWRDILASCFLTALVSPFKALRRIEGN